MEVDPEIACGIVGNMGQLWLKEEFIDLQINIDDYQFHCNRFVLCACSEFFQVLLQSEVRGEVEHPVRQVTIRGISPEIFQLVLKALYMGKSGLNTENMMEFWHAVHELQIPVLVEKCETFLSNHMTQENIVGIYSGALLLESKKVVKSVHEFMAENFEYFNNSQIFFLLSVKGVLEIFSSDNLKVDTQNYLVESILKWVSHEPCGNNVGQVCAGDFLRVQDRGDQRLEQSAGVIKGKLASVEVIFEKPPTTSQDSCLQTVGRLVTEAPTARKASLGKLLKLVQFSEVSRDCVEMLADTDMIMGVKETRDIVMQAIESHSKVLESVESEVLPTNSDHFAPALPVKTEKVVIFQKENSLCLLMR